MSYISNVFIDFIYLSFYLFIVIAIFFKYIFIVIYIIFIMQIICFRDKISIVGIV